MSTYDRRTWQRPKGERTVDPDWEDQVEEATARRSKVRGISSTGGIGIAGNRAGRGMRRRLRNKYKREA